MLYRQKILIIRYLVLVIFLVIPHISLAEETYLDVIYKTYKAEGLEAIQNKKQFTLVFLEPSHTRYDILKIRFKEADSMLLIIEYSPLGKRLDGARYQIKDFEYFLDNYQDLKFMVMRIR